MLREQARLFNRLAMALDAVVIFASLVMAYSIQTRCGNLSGLQNYLWILLIFAPVTYYMLIRYRLYASLRTRSLSDIIFPLLKANAVGGGVLATSIYLLEPGGLNRELIGLFFLFSCVLLTFEKVALKLFLGSFRKKGYNLRFILIVGTGAKSEKFAEYILKHSAWGLRIVGFLRDSEDIRRETVLGYPVLGSLENLVELCKARTIDEVVFCPSKEHIAHLEDYLEAMEELGITVRMTLDFYRVGLTKQEVSLFHDEIPMITFYQRSFNAERLFLKRCLDILGALVGLAITAVLLPFIAPAIKADSPGPVFFGQKRVGKNGRTFTCWKFRTMVTDAEERKKDLMAMNEVKGAMFKMKDDPRVTRVGRFLRKTSLDELPQFWNVLKGEMSLVGTRPPTPSEVASYENWHHRRICIKPGVTGLWQVSGRNEIKDFDEIVRLDLTYVDNWSLQFDIEILLKTLGAVFSRKGSH